MKVKTRRVNRVSLHTLLLILSLSLFIVPARVAAQSGGNRDRPANATHPEPGRPSRQIEASRCDIVFVSLKSHELTNDQKNCLQALAKLVIDNDLAVVIDGHRDKNEDSKADVSLRRANNVRDFLTGVQIEGASIDGAKIKVKDFGKSCPLAPEAINKNSRRVKIWLVTNELIDAPELETLLEPLRNCPAVQTPPRPNGPGR